MVWDPTERPRKPRLRSTHHFVPSIEERRVWFEQPRIELSEEETRELAALVPSEIPKDFLRYFIHSAGRNFGWDRWTSNAPKPLIRYELRLLAHLIWKRRNFPELTDEIDREFFDHLGNIDCETKKRLLDGMSATQPGDSDPIWFLYGPKGVNLQAVFQGALYADQTYDSRGDYRDIALHKTSAFLAYIYYLWTDEVPSIGCREVGEVTSQATASRVADSAFARFAYAFFEKVDPRLSKSRISSAIEARASDLRALEAQGDFTDHDLVNLSVS